jgi:hypothetical protein
MGKTNHWSYHAAVEYGKMLEQVERANLRSWGVRS